MNLKRVLVFLSVVSFCISSFAKDACRPSSDTIMLLSEGGSIPSDSASFFYSASRLPKILKCAESGELKEFYCLEWEGAVFDTKSKKVTQGGKIVFDIKSGMIKDIMPSTNEKGFKYLVDKELKLIDGDLEKNIISFINSKMIASKASFPQMTLVESKAKPNDDESISKTVKVITSLIKDATGSLHLNCGRTSKISSNYYKLN